MKVAMSVEAPPRRDLAYEHIRELEAENGSLKRQLAKALDTIRLRATRRRVYGPGPWWCENEGCGAKIERPTTPKRGFCPRCYMSFYRGEKPEPLGSVDPKITLSYASIEEHVQERELQAI